VQSTANHCKTSLIHITETDVVGKAYTITESCTEYIKGFKSPAVNLHAGHQGSTQCVNKGNVYIIYFPILFNASNNGFADPK
jgi:hypothetical protein